MAFNMETVAKQNGFGKDSEREDIPKERPANANLVTIDRARAEDFLMILEECAGGVEEQRGLVESLIASKNAELQGFQSETIGKFNALIQATGEPSEKIKAAESLRKLSGGAA